MAVGEQAFFQIAVALIPILTFGGIFVSRANIHGPVTVPEAWETTAIALLGLLSIEAEIIAIRGAVVGESNAFDRIFVISMILIGMLAIVLGTVVPRYLRMDRASKGAGGRGLKNVGVIAVLIALIFLAWSSVNLLNESIRLGEGKARAHRIDQLNEEIRGAYIRINAIGRRQSRLLLMIEAAGDRPHPTSLDRSRFRVLRQEYRSNSRLEGVELDRVVRLVQKQNHLYAETFPP